MKNYTFEEFQTVLTEKVQAKLDEKITVRINDVTKNNGVVLKGMTFFGQGEVISPTIYLEPYYEAYKEGCEWSEIVGRIVDTFRIGTKDEIFDIQSFINFKEAKEHIAFKVVNYEKNIKLLEQIPHKKFLDLAVVYYYLVNHSELDNATILIYNNHLETWGITADELDEIARDNTPHLLNADLRSITEVLSELLSRKNIDTDFLDEELCEEEENGGMYVLSNKTKIFGAAVMLYSEVLKKFAEKKQTDLFILPSSVHEVIIIPKTEGMEWKKLQEMVIEVNATQVEDIEILSDSVYCYSREKDELIPAWEVA